MASFLGSPSPCPSLRRSNSLSNPLRPFSNPTLLPRRPQRLQPPLQHPPPVFLPPDPRHPLQKTIRQIVQLPHLRRTDRRTKPIFLLRRCLLPAPPFPQIRAAQVGGAAREDERGMVFEPAGHDVDFGRLGFGGRGSRWRRRGGGFGVAVGEPEGGDFPGGDGVDGARPQAAGLEGLQHGVEHGFEHVDAEGPFLYGGAAHGAEALSLD